MDIEGLSYNAYYLHNPIWVDVTDLTNLLTLTVIIQGKQYNFSMTPSNGVVRFDLSNIILGLIQPIRNKTKLLSLGGTWFIDGYYQVTLGFSDSSFGTSFSSASIKLDKSFVIGGVSGYHSNVPVGNTLSLGNRKWANLPSYDFKLTDGRIVGTTINETNRRNRVDCTNAYIIFRNRLGGMSSYLFEDFTLSEKAKDLGYYITDDNIIDSGTELDKSITLQTKLVRDDYELARHLIDSQEVYLYNQGGELTRLVGANAIDVNDKLTVQDFSITFNYAINYSKQW